MLAARVPGAIWIAMLRFHIARQIPECDPRRLAPVCLMHRQPERQGCKKLQREEAPRFRQQSEDGSIETPLVLLLPADQKQGRILTCSTGSPLELRRSPGLAFAPIAFAWHKATSVPKTPAIPQETRPVLLAGDRL